MRNLPKILLLLACSFLAFYSAKEMLVKPLWGYFPLILFVSSFFGFIVLFKSWFYRTKQDKYYLQLSLAGGLILSLGFPPMPTTPLMLLGFAPWLILEDLISENGTVIRKATLFKYMYTGFLFWNILTTFWVTNSAFMAGIVAITLNSLFMSVPFLLFHITKVKLGKSLGYISFIVFWLSFEYNHLNWEISWPWLTLGNGLSQYPSLIQWYEYSGVAGGSLLILLANLVSFFVWKSWRARKKRLAKTLLVLNLMIWIIPSFLSLNIWSNYKEKGISKDFVVIQPNWEPHYEKFEVPEKTQLKRFIDLSHSALDSTVDYLIFPETSFESVNANSLESDRNLLWMIRMVNDYPKLNLITGIGSYRVFKSDEERPKAIREKILSSGDTLFLDYQNAAIQISSHDDTIQFYNKSKLVPGAEFLPYKNLLFFFKPLVDKLGGTIFGYTAQAERSCFLSNGTNIAPVICYESVYGEYCTGYVKEGANAFCIVTNDGWWDDTPGFRQHLKIGALRAIETRKPIARSANTGCSAFINQRGEIQQPTQYGVQAVIRQKMLCN
ncbi:MAG TPA: apolipoprotein N-acyltransferase, partial [Saprospiraceae bacterium]|nr:apolipoprotein N-acyltransferase [Saprospiraceae bacterium]